MLRYLLSSACLLMIFSFSGQAQSATSACACCTPAHRQFDFWLGSWQTFMPDSTLAGTNDIVVIQDSCVIRENWTSARGTFTGTSYNYFDARDSTWNQLWLDNQGGQLILKGRRVGNQMILSSGITFDRSGKPLIHRITWTANDDGTVRQHWQSSSSSDEWTTLFDGLYRRIDARE